MKKNPLLPTTLVNKFERSVAPLKEGEEKTHYRQQHQVNLFELF
jgi:hypothetical protein